MCPRASAISTATGSASRCAGSQTSSSHVAATHSTTASASSSLPANWWYSAPRV